MGGRTGRNFLAVLQISRLLKNFVCRLLEIRIPRRAREGDDVTDVFKAGEIHHHSFQSKTETGVGDGAVPAQVEIPPISFFIQTAVAEPLQEHIVSVFALAAADDLPDPGNQERPSPARFCCRR